MFAIKWDGLLSNVDYFFRENKASTLVDPFL